MNTGFSRVRILRCRLALAFRSRQFTSQNQSRYSTDEREFRSVVIQALRSVPIFKKINF